MGIQIPEMINISEVPMGNMTIQGTQTYCVYFNYSAWITINVVLLTILAFKINSWLYSKARPKEDDFATGRLKYLLSDDFFIGSLYTINLFMFFYTIFFGMLLA